MNEERLRKVMQDSFNILKPKIDEMTNLMMDCYQQGFEDCWKALTDKEF